MDQVMINKQIHTANQATDQTKVWKFIYGFAESLVLRCSVELEIADTIHKHGEPMTLSELASQLPKQPVEISRLYRIIRYLVHVKLYTKAKNPISGEVRYGLSPQAKYLIRGWPKSMVPTILSLDDKDLMKARHYLKDGLVENCIPFDKAIGKSRWDYMSDNPEMSEIFNESMASDTRSIISALVNDCRSVFEGVKGTLVDVGGNTGTAAKAISSAFPHLKCSVYDLPHVIAAASPSDHPNIKFIEGDMFKSVPSADAILMKYILHDWNDEECIEILKQCKKAVPREGGIVIIVDVVLNKDWSHPLTKMRLAFDLHMMLVTGGKERSEDEWKELFEAADFNGYKIVEISAVQSVIVAYPY